MQILKRVGMREYATKNYFCNLHTYPQIISNWEGYLKKKKFSKRNTILSMDIGKPLAMVKFVSE